MTPQALPRELRHDPLLRLASGAAGLAALVLAWDAGHRALGPLVLPAPSETFDTLLRLIASGAAWPALRVTAADALGGWLAGALLGASLGVAGGLVPPLGAALRPVTTVVLGVPPIAWVVLALLWFGPTGLSAGFTVLVTVLPIVFAGAFQGIQARSPALGEMARAFGAPPLLKLRALIVPQLLDHLLPALATALAFAWKVAVMAEVLGGGTGIGGEIATARAHLDLAETLAWVVLAVMLMLACDATLLAPIRRRTRGVMLTFADVRLGFSDGPVFNRLDLVIAPGKLVALLGRSGCGKTTALRLAAGLIRPDAGRVDIRFRRTAMVFQEPRLLPWASARDNAAFGLAARGVPRRERRARADALLTAFGFTAADLDKRPAQLSGGMQSRVAIARAFAIEPDLVLMDEPFAALDIGLRRDLQDLVRETVDRRGSAVLFVTHDITEAVRLADRILVLSPRPAQVVFDRPSQPIAEPAAIHAQASALFEQPAVRSAMLAR